MKGATTPYVEGATEVYAHKLLAPQGHADAVWREAILDRVFHDNALRVVVLQGPAGHGKSTTLQQIKTVCESRNYLTGWLNFDEADNDLRRFSIHIHALVAELCGDPAQGAAQGGDDLVGSRRRRRSDWLLDRLARIDRPIGIFLDEFQTLTDGAVIGFCRELFEHVPHNVRFFMGSRSVPEIGLARLLVNNEALVLRADELRFTPTEVEQFFVGSGDLQVSPGEVDAIYRRTEGWPAALQLFRLSLASPSVRRSLDDVGAYRPRELAEYLTDTILSLQSPDIRHFLLRTSLLPRLTGPLCDAVTGGQDSQEILLQLERTGLFVRSLDSGLRWFKYHALFASFLADQLYAQSEADFNAVHRRAADWHLAQGQYEEAVYHSLECKNFTLAADTLNVWATRLVAGAHLITVERWYDRLPFEEIAQRLDLAIKVAYALVFLRRSHKLPPLLKLLESHSGGGDIAQTTNPDIVLSMAAICADDIPRAFEIISRVQLQGRQPEGFAAFELGAGANVVAYRHGMAGNFEQARQYEILARAYNERGEASFSGGYTFGVKGMNLIAQGELKAALELFRQGMAEQNMQIDKSFASAAVVSCYMWALYEANELDKVEALFSQNHDAIADAVLLDFLAVAVLAVSRTHDARGRAAKASAALEEAENIARENGWERLVRIVTWERVRRRLLLGENDKAKIIAAVLPAQTAALPEKWVPFSDNAESELFGRIRLALCELNFAAAATMISAELRLNDGRQYRKIRLHLLDALLHEKKGARNAAHRSLRKALQLGEVGGFVRCFLDEGDAILRLLREEYQAILESSDSGVANDAESLRGYIEGLLQASGTDLGRTPTSLPERTVEPLTDREKEILIFLADGVSNKEMAKRIFLSENTIKFHLKNIYSKLAVRNRLQAIASGRQLGLIR